MDRPNRTWAVLSAFFRALLRGSALALLLIGATRASDWNLFGGKVPFLRFEEPRRIDELSSRFAEKSPTVTRDDLEIFFNSNRAGVRNDIPWKHGPFRLDIFRATRAEPDDAFGAPETVVTDAWTPEVSDDGLELFFLREIRPEWTDVDGDLFVMRRADRSSPFGNPARIDGVRTPFLEASPSVTGDGLTLYFHSTRPDGEGRTDLWVATRRRRDAPFGRPRNLVELNTPFHDHAPCVSSDGGILFFASNRPGGAGGEDIWVALRDESTGLFGNARPVDDVNSTAVEKAPEISADGGRLYFRSTRAGGAGRADLYVAARRRPAPRGAFGSDSILISKPRKGAPRSKHVADDESEGIRWEADLESAMARARREHKPVFLACKARRLGSPDAEFY